MRFVTLIFLVLLAGCAASTPPVSSSFPTIEPSKQNSAISTSTENQKSASINQPKTASKPTIIK